MIAFQSILNFFPEYLGQNALLHKYMLKEYILLMILDFLSTTGYVRKMNFIGGTCIRLTKGIDRFSEDLDFDIKDLSKDEFMTMTDAVMKFLQNNGLPAMAKDRPNPRLKAFRRNIYFPELLYSLGMSGHRDERFLIKIECQDQQVNYTSKMTKIKGCGYFLAMPVPADETLCSMKLTAMFNRNKGRDFYDVLFLLSQTLPDFAFLNQRLDIPNILLLKQKAALLFHSIDLYHKKKDFEHLLFNKSNSSRILQAPAFFEAL